MKSSPLPPEPLTSRAPRRPRRAPGSPGPLRRSRRAPARPGRRSTRGFLLGLVLLVASAPLAPSRAVPPVFPVKQLVFRTDEYVTTPYKRPGDGTRRRLPAGWKGLSLTPETFPDDRIPAVRRKRSLDHVYYPAENGRILRINNRSEFCAWALDQRILDVHFLDLGFHAGKDDCARDLAYYERTQHPANDEHLYVRGRTGATAPDPFAGRPADAMYGDAVLFESRLRQRRADSEARLFWYPLGIGDTAQGQGMVEAYLTITSEDILPLKFLGIWLVAEHTDRANQEAPVRVDTVGPTPVIDLPEVLSPGETRTYLFQETIPMRDVQGRNMRLHFVMDLEDPWGRTIRKVHRTHYWKAEW